MKPIRADRGGIEGLPLRLLMVSMLVSLTVPVFLGAMQSHSMTLTETIVEERMDSIEESAISAFLGGPGSVRTLDMDMGPFTGEIVIGGPRSTPDSRSISYTGGGLEIRRYIDEIPLEMTSSGNGLTISSPCGVIRFECVSQGDQIWIEVEAMN
jgi:hypothetical protein